MKLFYNQLNRSEVSLLLIVFAIVLLSVFNVRAADGDLDASFGTGGRVLTASTTPDNLERIALQSDGKIVAVGQFSAGGSISGVLVRYSSNGSIDTTFGTDGRVNFSPGGGFWQLYDVAAQADGKIVAAGISALSRVLVVRFNSNGSLDTTFNGSGFINTQIGLANSLEIERQTGKIVVGGATVAGGRADFTLWRYNPDGTPDATFDGDGVVTTAIGAASTLNTNGIIDFKILDDGKYVGVGSTATNTAAANLTVVRYNNNGSLDTAFGGVGYAVKNIADNNSTGLAMDVQADGKIVTVGASFTASATFARFNQDGSMDGSFGTGGFAFYPAGGDNFMELLIQPDGKILTAGRRLETSANNTDFILVRLNTNGSLDPLFGAGGRIFTNFGTNTIDEAKSILLQPDGKIVAAGISYVPGGFNYKFALARYQNSLSQVPINNPTLRFADFDGDGKTDVSVFRSGTWFVNASSGASASFGVQFGQAGDSTVPADYDGDGKSDIAVWRAAAFANFFILNSSNNTFRAEQFGTSGDNPTVSGDWDADGKADLAVYRNASTSGGQSFFYYRPSSQPGVNFIPVQWGTSGDTAIFGDFDGDRRLNPAVYRPANNTFYVRQSSNNAALVRQWGNAPTDAIFAGDFDGDGKSDFAVQRFSGAEAGTWYVAQSGGTNRAFVWGTGSDVPVPADYDGDGRMDVAVFRRANRTWYILASSDNQPRYSVFGASSDFPLPLNLVR